MSFSLAPAGSPAVPRVAASWVRATALPAIAVALDDVAAARDRARQDFLGVSGGAYALHADTLLAHLATLRDRLLGAAVLFEAYADRLTAHQATLEGVRARALACGLEVVGDTVLPPTGGLDSVAWSQLASAVAHEHQSLAAWVASELDAAVPSYTDPDLAGWVAGFLDANRVSLAAGALEVVFTRGSLVSAGRGLLETAARLDRLAKVPGPVSTVVGTVSALESDTPAEDVAGVAGGVATAALVTAGVVAAVPAAPVVAVGALGTLVAIGGSYAAKWAWRRLPEDFQDAADEVVDEAWDEVKDEVKEEADEAWEAAGDAVEDVGQSVLTWARP